MTATVTNWVDVTAGSAKIVNMIGSASPGANRRIIALQQGNMVRFVGYSI